MGQQGHEFSVYSGGGLSTLKYKTTIGDRKNGLGGLFGFGYSYFFTNHIGIGTGMELSSYHAKMLVDNLSDKYMTTDFDDDEFEFRTTVNNYTEKQNALMINIPLMVQYHTGKNNRFYIAAGGKAGIPVRGKYRTSGAEMKNSGYYAMENYEYTTQEFLGFGTFKGKDTNGTIDLNVAWMLSAEAGIKWKLKENMFLYTGIYFDYGLNDFGKSEHNEQFVQYNRVSPGDFTTNSVLTSRYTQDGHAEKFTDKVVPLAAGIKIRLAFSKTCSKKIEQPLPTPAIQPVPDPPILVEVELPVDTDSVTEISQEDTDTKVDVAIVLDTEEAETDDGLTEVKEKITGTILLYPLNSAELNIQQKTMLDDKVVWLKKYPDLKIICEGHTCNLGNDAFNMNLGLKRAENVKRYLVEKGIDANRISVTTKGKTSNVVPNDSEDNRLKNRRVEIRVME